MTMAVSDGMPSGRRQRATPFPTLTQYWTCILTGLKGSAFGDATDQPFGKVETCQIVDKSPYHSLWGTPGWVGSVSATPDLADPFKCSRCVTDNEYQSCGWPANAVLFRTCR